ncbi:hypothetical protein VPHG_00107 [Vibrio phage 11895-B1]|uniref:hypothetical protein n=1 Tax=Vibrio phage 11895-B1 TaxID=754075 RepID=UPI0002C0F9B6|nr:hypothetical protein VPHG_00107 [Vibrio phage 11895-B1]AGH32174.1 hypothetical protein VPHG_00107 [Vibrio phage 11895-B1]
MSDNYASGGLTLSWNGIDISDGFQGLQVNRAGNLVDASYDLRGRRTLSTLANQSAEIVITYTQTDDTLKKLDTAAAALQLAREFISVPTEGVLIFKDVTGSTGSFVAWNLALLSTGDEEWADVVGTREVTFDCEKLIRTDDPVSVLANIASYL